MVPSHKACLKCNETKPIGEFYKAKLGKYGYHGNCKVCMLSYQKSYHDNIKPIRKAKAAKYYVENKQFVDARNKSWIEKNKSRKSASAKVWAQKHPERRAQVHRAYYQKNRDRLLRQGNVWKTKRLNEDPLFKMLVYIRNRTRQAFKQKGIRKRQETKELIGVEITIAKAHIERQFKRGMSWENYGQWHIDHKIPLASAKTEDELKVLCHYTNLQPLWASENIKKSKKIIPVQVLLTI